MFEGLSRKRGELDDDSQGIPETSCNLSIDFLVVSSAAEPCTAT
jgi:hypothetical protein